MIGDIIEVDGKELIAVEYGFNKNGQCSECALNKSMTCWDFPCTDDDSGINWIYSELSRPIKVQSADRAGNPKVFELEVK